MSLETFDLSDVFRPGDDLTPVNAELENATPAERIAWAGRAFGARLVLSTSFGAYSAVMLHLVTRVIPDVKVLFVDNGHLTSDTYRFKRALSQSLGLNVRTFVPARTRAELEAIDGSAEVLAAREDSLKRLAAEVKVEPFERGLSELGAAAWMSGVLRGENSFRGGFSVVMRRGDGLCKVHPILEWTTRDCRNYLDENGLPVNENYFDVCKSGNRECGIHLTGLDRSLVSSDL